MAELQRPTTYLGKLEFAQRVRRRGFAAPRDFRLEVKLTDDATGDGIARQNFNRVRRSRGDRRRRRPLKNRRGSRWSGVRLVMATPGCVACPAP